MLNKKIKRFEGDISGSAMNTPEGTVTGVMYGNESNLMIMKHWLKM